MRQKDAALFIRFHFHGIAKKEAGNITGFFLGERLLSKALLQTIPGIHGIDIDTAIDSFGDDKRLSQFTPEFGRNKKDGLWRLHYVHIHP